MFLFFPIHFLKFLVKSQPQRSHKKGSYKKKSALKLRFLTMILLPMNKKSKFRLVISERGKIFSRYLFVYLFTCVFIYLSIYLFIYLIMTRTCIGNCTERTLKHSSRFSALRCLLYYWLKSIL